MFIFKVNNLYYISYENKELKIKLNKNNKSINNPRIHINCVQYLPKKLNKNLLSFTQSQFFQYKIGNERPHMMIHFLYILFHKNNF